MRQATSLALATLLSLATLATASADIHVPDMTARQAARMRATIARTLTARGAGTFTAKDIAFDSAKRYVQGPAAGRKTRTSKIGFFAVTSTGKPEVRSHIGPIPWPHEVTPATGIAGELTIRVGRPKQAWSRTHRLDYTITSRGIKTEAAPVALTLNN